MKKALLIAVLPAALCACRIIPEASSGPRVADPLPEAPLPPAAAQPVPSPLPSPGFSGLVWASIGQKVYVDGPSVTPLQVLEDSRCAVDTQCVWAGRVRLLVKVHLGTGDVTRELTSGEPIQVADGTLELVEVRPVKTSDPEASGGAYSFAFRFMGGL